MLNHSGDTAVIISVACGIPGRVALDLFQLVGVPAGVRVSDSGSVLVRRPDVGCTGYVASIFGARPQVPGFGKKSKANVSSFADEVTMVIEGHFRVSVHTKKFSRIYFLQCLHGH